MAKTVLLIAEIASAKAKTPARNETKVFKILFVPIKPAISALRLLNNLIPKKAIATIKITQRIMLVKSGLSITCFTPSFVVSFSITPNLESSFFIKKTGLKKRNFSERVAT